jgi:hypothetical protein
LKEKELFALKRTLTAEIAERQKYLDAVDVLLDRLHQQNGTGTLDAGTAITSAAEGNGRRVRGTLKAAKKAVDSLAADFTREQLFAKVEADNPMLAGKISPEAQRSTMRTLIKEGWIFVSDEGLGTYHGLRLGTV